MQAVRATLQTLLLALLIAAATGNALAQSRPANPAWQVPGKWRPWRMDGQSPDLAKCATRAEWSAMEANLRKIRSVWEKIPAIAEPIGYEIDAFGSFPVQDPCLRTDYPKERGRGQRPYVHRNDKTGPLTGYANFYPFRYDSIEPKLGVERETLALHFHVNRIFESNLALLDHEFVEPVRAPDLFGAPNYQIDGATCVFTGGCEKRAGTLIISNSEASWWKPVPLLDIYDLLLVQAQVKVETFEMDVENRRRDLDELMSPRKRSMLEGMCRRDSVAGWQKKPPDDYFASCMDSSKKNEERKAREIADAGPQKDPRWASWLRGRDRIDTLRTALLAQDPKAFAYLCGSPRFDFSNVNNHLSEYADQFRSAPAQGCRQVVRANEAFFNPRLPRSSIQLITVTGFQDCFDLGPIESFTAPGKCQAIFRLLQNIDWASVRGLIDR